MNFRSVADLSRTLATGSDRLPEGIELIVGIPRSGLLAANLLSLHLNLPLADLDGFLEGRVLAAGARLPHVEPDFLDEPRRVLVLDDSLYTGRMMGLARQRIEEAGVPHRVFYGAVYAHVRNQSLLDVHFEVVPPPRIFEWNVLHGEWIENACVDIDGVLCPDPTAEENDDGPRYAAFLRRTPPLYRVSRPVGWLVTNRLERYRDETEAWLRERGIEWRNLVMLDLPDAETRRRLAPYAEFKAGVYRQADAQIFIESDPVQAAEIARIAGRPVYCVSDRRLYRAPFSTAAPVALKKAPRRLVAWSRDVAERLAWKVGKLIGR